jgi:hypothetical protein
MKYRAIQLQGKGGLDQLCAVELPLYDPKPGELRIRVRAARAGFTDITMRRSFYPHALYIGVGVSMTIHWFSDFSAGAIIGTAIGAVVGKSFLRSQMTPAGL